MKHCPRCQQTYPDEQRFCLDDGELLSLRDPYHLVGCTLADKYRLDALIGIGGMGAVYSAHHLDIDRHIAIKILQPNVALGNAHITGLFEREAKIVGRLFHENIVNIFDAGRTTDDIAYIAMEWLDGHTLQEELAAHGRLSSDRTMEILRQIADALEEAHARHIIHRDLKPSNIMLIKRKDGRERIKVLDFGISKVLSITAGSPVSLVTGTPHYASPEQFQVGANIDGRSDIYSLGVMLYEMLTGAIPFNASSAHELIHLHMTAMPPPLRQLRPDAPVAVEQLVDRMLAKEPDQRPQHVSEIPMFFEHALGRSAQAQAATIIDETLIPMPQEEGELPLPPNLIAPSHENVKTAPLILPNPNSLPIAANEAVLPVRLPPYSRLALVIGVSIAVIVIAAVLVFRYRNPVRNESVKTSNGIEFVQISGGEFAMGATNGDDDETPVHQVLISRSFEIGKYEVTQTQWEIVMSSNPSHFKGANLPVDNVSWDAVQTFISVLNGRNDGYVYRLPTEAEWEYACRAGSKKDYAGNLDEMGWHNVNAGGQTHPVGQKQPNAWGIYDMHGNVWEWVQDWYDDYPSMAVTDPVGPSSGSARVSRGGSWGGVTTCCRSADRLHFSPSIHYDGLGFRLVRTPK